MIKLKTWLSIAKPVSMDLVILCQSCVSVSKQSNRAEFSIIIDQGCPLIIYPESKADRWVLNGSKTMPNMITVRFNHSE